MTEAKKFQDYLKQLRTPFIPLKRLRFLQPDGSTAFALDNNQKNKRSGAFIQSGNISVNRQNGRRRTASVTLSNIDRAYDYNVNKIWFGQEIAVDEGLVLSDGYEYYIQQGIFLVENPQEIFKPSQKTVDYSLVDKWANLDGGLFGYLESTYEVPVDTNIFEPITGILNLDRGNGRKVDSKTPIYTDYYNNRTQMLPDGTTKSLVVSPYTMRVDSENGTYADVIIGMTEMVNAWVGYDSTGSLLVEPSQDDIDDSTKPVLWRFSPEEITFLGATYTTKNTEVYNDYIVIGEALEGYTQPNGRAQNLDPRSDTNVNIIGRKTYRMSNANYYTNTQCQDLAAWKLKRASALQKSVSIQCSQIYHIRENDLVEIVRTDKPGQPTEKHLILGFSRPLSSTGEMTINCVSVQDYPNATLTSWT